MSSVSTVRNPEAGRIHMGVMETAAFKQADAQAREKDAPDPRVSPLPSPGSFPCQQLKPGHVRYVTDDFCADYRRRCVCFDCYRGMRLSRERADASGILPNIIAKKEGQDMAKKGTCEGCGRNNMTLPAKGLCGTCYNLDRAGNPLPRDEKKPDQATATPTAESKPEAHPMMAMQDSSSAPSWDDFTAFVPTLNRSQGCFARIERDKINLSSDLCIQAGFKVGDFVELGFNPGTKDVAIRKATPSSAYKAKLYSGKASSALACSCKAMIDQLGVELNKRSPVDVHAWGIVIHAGEGA